METKQEIIGGSLELVCLMSVLFFVVYWFSYTHPDFSNTIIGQISPWAAWAVIVLGFISGLTGERILKKESRRNRFIAR